jgi:uncharacterized protein YggE
MERRSNLISTNYMEKILRTSMVLLFLVTTAVQAQSTEKFIRIIGNAKKELTTNSTKIKIAISEQKANKYNKELKDISYTEAYDHVIKALSNIGITENDIELIIDSKSYSRVESKNFYILTSLDKLKQISDLEVNGFKVIDIKYLFDISDENLEVDLSLDAIKDAKRKAKSICDEIDKKVGKILNIEIRESAFGSQLFEHKESTYTKTYKVAITFKLID